MIIRVKLTGCGEIMEAVRDKLQDCLKIRINEVEFTTKEDSLNAKVSLSKSGDSKGEKDIVVYQIRTAFPLKFSHEAFAQFPFE